MSGVISSVPWYGWLMVGAGIIITVTKIIDAVKPKRLDPLVEQKFESTDKRINKHDNKIDELCTRQDLLESDIRTGVNDMRFGVQTIQQAVEGIERNQNLAVKQNEKLYNMVNKYGNDVIRNETNILNLKEVVDGIEKRKENS